MPLITIARQPKFHRLWAVYSSRNGSNFLSKYIFPKCVFPKSICLDLFSIVQHTTYWFPNIATLWCIDIVLSFVTVYLPCSWLSINGATSQKVFSQCVFSQNVFAKVYFPKVYCVMLLLDYFFGENILLNQFDPTNMHISGSSIMDKCIIHICAS